MEVVHRGVKITLTKEGKFEAHPAGVRHLRASLSSAKKAVDEELGSTFQPFAALVMAIEAPGYARVMVVGKKKVAHLRHRTTPPMWITDTRGRTATVYADTPGNVAAMAKAYEVSQQFNIDLSALRDRYRIDRAAVVDAIPAISLGDVP